MMLELRIFTFYSSIYVYNLGSLCIVFCSRVYSACVQVLVNFCILIFDSMHNPERYICKRNCFIIWIWFYWSCCGWSWIKSSLLLSIGLAPQSCLYFVGISYWIWFTSRFSWLQASFKYPPGVTWRNPNKWCWFYYLDFSITYLDFSMWLLEDI